MAEKKVLNPAALTVEEAAKTLGIRQEWLEADIEAGAPTNADGTVNLVHYGAWLNVRLETCDLRPEGPARGRSSSLEPHASGLERSDNGEA